MTHVLPSQCSTSVDVIELFCVAPTAVQFVAAGHATANNRFVEPVAFGEGLTVHVLPSHCSVRVTRFSPEFAFPTAMQFVVDGQRTASSSFDVDPTRSGLTRMLHALPCNSSTSVWLAPARSMRLPTAIHIVAEGHDTDAKRDDAASGILVDCCDHAEPFQCIASGVDEPSLATSEPTA